LEVDIFDVRFVASDSGVVLFEAFFDGDSEDFGIEGCDQEVLRICH
jgi:hypothetical protein